jgi:hypothetical protein
MGKRSFRFYIRCQVLMAACMSIRCTSETSVYYNEATWCDIPEGSNLHLGFSLTAITYTPQELEILNFVTKMGYKHPYKLCTDQQLQTWQWWETLRLCPTNLMQNKLFANKNTTAIITTYYYYYYYCYCY